MSINSLKTMKDQDLLSQTKRLAEKEREVLTEVLHHLSEIERRRLFSDLGYQSLFDYAVKELKYSDGQAGRRIQAIRMMKEIPEVEKKIVSGALTLTNVSKAQSYFRNIKERIVEKDEKLAVLKILENKSTRDCEKELIKLQPSLFKLKEKERVLSEDHSELKLVLDAKTKKKLEGIRSLLGIKGSKMTYLELLNTMADLSKEVLIEKKFGKNRVKNLKIGVEGLPVVTKQIPTDVRSKNTTPAPELKLIPTNPRYISKEKAYSLWQRDQKCTICGSNRNLNIDHIRPVAIGGTNNIENLRILCFNCNQREAIKVFGIEKVVRT